MNQQSGCAVLQESKSRQSDLSALFSPRAIAVVGATDEISRAGGRALAVLKMVGYEGAIYPVNPRRPSLQGFKAYPSVEELPAPADLAIICLAPGRVPAAIRQCGESGIRAAVVFADGFVARLREELSEAVAVAQRASGLRLLGPNTIGFRSVEAKVYGTFAGDIELGTLLGSTAFRVNA